ncbi:unnamed protein product [Brassica oleracea]
MVKVETYHTGSKRKPIAQLRRTINNRVWVTLTRAFLQQ